jgi:hypothetical protein
MRALMSLCDRQPPDLPVGFGFPTLDAAQYVRWRPFTFNTALDLLQHKSHSRRSRHQVAGHMEV